MYTVFQVIYTSFRPRENAPVFVANSGRHDDVLMTFDEGTSLLYVVNVRNARNCMCYSQISAVFK